MNDMPPGLRYLSGLIEYGELPALVRTLRRGRPYSELAKECDVSASTLQRMEAGEPVAIGTVREIATYANQGIVIGPRDGAAPAEDFEIIESAPTPDTEH